MRDAKVQFVLNRPRNPKNIGAAARGMANFGFRDLAVVAPYSVAWREIRSAVQAGPVVENAKKYKSLKDAVRASHLVIGTSAGSRRKLNETWILLDGLPALVNKARRAKKNVSVVFGSEKSGLSNEDLGFCHVIVKIPTVPECPSMNLAQAVAVVAFALRGESQMLPVSKEKTKPVSMDHMERLVQHGLDAFSAAKLLNRWTREGSEQRIRKAFHHWNLSAVDVALLHGIFKWVIQKAKK